ncbi:MAG: hypothetical protein QXR87_01135 [Candidatus Hadarchaeales archaeon]
METPPAPKRRFSKILLVLVLGVALLLYPRLLGLPLLLLPGYLLSLAVWPRKGFWERAGLSFGLGLLVSIWIGFLLARFLTLTFASYTASTLAVSLALLPFVRKREEPKLYLSALRRGELPPRPPRLSLLFALVLGLSVLPLVLCFEYWEIPITTVDGGLFYALAQQIGSTGRFVENYTLSVPAQSVPVQTQGLSLLVLMLHRGLGVSLATACQIFPVLLFVAFSAPLSLFARRWGKFAALAVIPLVAASRVVTVFAPAEFDRRSLQLALSVWTVFLLLKVLESRSLRESAGWSFLAGWVFALFALSWPGWLYLVPVVVAVPVVEILVRFVFYAKPEQGLPHLAGVGILLATAQFLAWGIGGVSLRSYADLASMITSYLGGGEWTRLVYQEKAPGSVSQILESLFSRIFWVPVGVCIAAGVLFLAIGLIQRRSIPAWRTVVILLVWFAVVVGMCWPGKGYNRFVLFLAPIVALAASIPVGLSEKVGKLRGLAPVFLCILLTFSIITSVSETRDPPEWAGNWEEAREFFAACRWLRENAKPGSLLMAEFRTGYLLEAFGGVRTLADPSSYEITDLGENLGSVPPFWLAPNFGGTQIDPDLLIPHPPTMGRAPDAVWAHYLDEDELAQLLQLYEENWGLKVDYLLLSFRRLGWNKQFQRVRTEDFFGWENFEFPAEGGNGVASIGGSQLSIAVQFRPPSFNLNVRVDGISPAAILYCQRERDRMGVERTYMVKLEVVNPSGSKVVLVLPPELRGGRLFLTVGMAKVHEKPPALQRLRGREELENFEAVYRGETLALVRVIR